MKRLLSTTGGRPIKNEDLERYLQSFQLWEGFLKSSFSLAGAILHGCNISGSVGSYNITAGVIYYDGNICLFDGATGVSLPLELIKDTTESDPREYKDLVTKNTLETIKMIPGTVDAFELDLTSARADEVFSNASAAVVASTANTAKIGGLNRKVVEIGDWDMLTDDLKQVTHGIASGSSKIRAVEVLIRNDAGTATLKLDYNIVSGATQGSIGFITDTQIFLGILVGGTFDSVDYDATSYNRGWVTIDYID